MLKKINQYLVTHYPQIWNTKLVWVLPVSILLNICFWVAGYMAFNPRMLNIFSYLEIGMISEYFVYASAIASIFVFILWLVFYLRNNPLKRMYPLSRAYFLKELIIIFTIVLCSALFFKSYMDGFYYQARHNDTEETMINEANTANLAMAFIPVLSVDYSKRFSCRMSHYIDSLYKHPYKESVARQLIAEAEIDTSLSINYYCSTSIKFLTERDKLLSKNSISDSVNAMLERGNKKEVAALLAKFEEICKKYHVKYDINISKYADYAFATATHTPNHFVYTFPKSPESSIPYAGVDEKLAEDAQKDTRKNFIAIQELEWALENTHRINDDKWDAKVWAIAILCILSISLFVFALRFAPIRTNIIAIVGQLVLPFLIAPVALLFKEKSNILALLICVFIVAYVLHILLRNRMKKLTGVLLVWLTWWMGILGPCILAYIHGKIRTYNIVNNTPVSNSSSKWLQDNTDILLLSYAVFAIIYVGFVIGNHYRTWTALPEE